MKTTSSQQQLKSVSVLTEDNVEIKVNTVLYRVKITNGTMSDYRDNHEPITVDVEALRVFYVNNLKREFRVRCLKGCEETFKVGNSCTTYHLFGKSESILKYFNKRMLKDHHKATQRLNFWKKSIDLMGKTRTAMSKIPYDKTVKIPAAVVVV